MWMDQNLGAEMQVQILSTIILLICTLIGNRSNVISHKSKRLYLRGFQVFNALIDYLLEHTELKTADQVILIGSSGKTSQTDLK